MASLTSTNENKTPTSVEVEVPKKPILLPLGPIADSLFQPFMVLLNNLYESFPNTPNEPLEVSEFLKSTIEGAIKNSALGYEKAEIYQKIVLEVVILRLLSTIINEFYDQNNQSEEQLSSKVFILLDISIYLTAISHDADIDLPFLVLHNIILKNDKKFVLSHFQNHFFSKASTSRRHHLIHDCGVTSATKRPGTELLEIYKDVTEIYSLKRDDHLKFIGYLRIFVSDCFNMDELALNNTNYDINKHFGAEKDVYNLKKRARNSPFTLYLKVRYQLTYPETMFMDRWISRDCLNAVYDLMDAIFDKDLSGKDYNNIWRNTYDAPKEKNELEINQLKTLAQDFQMSPAFSITEESFTDLFEDKVFRQFLTLQIFMMVSHIVNYWDTPAFKKSINVRSDMRTTKDFCLRVKKAIQSHYKNLDEKLFFTFTTIASDSNKFWVEWKAAGFKVVKDTKVSEELIDKARNSVTKNSRIRPRHIPKYGTNEISRIWKLETGLKNLNQSTTVKIELFEKLKEELDRLENTYNFMQEDPDMYTPSEIADVKTKKEMLTFKALRLYRENGNWLSFSNTNHKLGVKGLFDTSLISKFKEDQVQIEKERLEREKENEKEEDEDVVMETETSQTETVKKEEKATEEEEDLDY